MSWIQDNRKIIAETSNDLLKKQSRPLSRHLQGPVCKTITCFIVVAAVVPVLIYFVFIDLSYEKYDIQDTCLVNVNYRVPCGISKINESECSMVQCCFDKSLNTCYHYVPSRYNYKYNNLTNVAEPLQTRTPINTESIAQLSVCVKEDGKRLEITIGDSNISCQFKNEDLQYFWLEPINNMEYLEFDIYRRENREYPIFSTNIGPLIASEAYWEWTVNLHTAEVFGLGELLIENKTTVVYRNKDDHTTLPVFLAHTKSLYHGVAINNAGPLEIIVLPSKLIVLRILSGNSISITLSLGPSPEDVRGQLFVPVRIDELEWTLKPHICRDGDINIDQIAKEAYQFHLQNQDISYGSECFHENLFSRLHQVPDLISLEMENVLSTFNLKFLMSLPPQVTIQNKQLYEHAKTLNILYKFGATDTVFEGTYNNLQVAYPDFSNVKVEEWMAFVMSFKPITKADGFVLRDNWPAEDNFVMENVNKLPYLTKEIKLAMSNTIPWNATTETLDFHFSLHNTYGFMQENSIRQQKPGTFIVTSSSNIRCNSAVQIQNMDVSWKHLKKTLLITLYQSIFGHPLISVPVCGSSASYNHELHESLCIRWYIMAATLPLFRISSNGVPRDPGSLKTKFAQFHAKNAIKVRDTLQPYLFSILNSQKPITRPMFYNYPNDQNTINLTEQYMVGDILVVQPFSPGTYFLQFYLPTLEGVWYEYFGGREYSSGKSNITIVETDLVMFLPPGKIIPMKDDSDSSALSLYITLRRNCTEREICATGDLFITPDHYIEFQATSDVITIKLNDMLLKDAMNCKRNQGLAYPSIIQSVKAYGLKGSSACVFRRPIDLCSVSNFTYTCML